ncbi:MAG TPA: hypothetical protein VGF06_10000 [Terriglobales bacterium]|jgi:hypothetical protein
MKLRSILLWGIFLSSAAISQSTRAGDASSIERKLRHIESNGALAHPDPAPTQLTESEINAYLASGKVELPAGVRFVRVSGDSGSLSATARVNFEQIKTGRQSSNPLLSIFSGEHDVAAEAHARGSGGTGYVDIDSVALDGVEIPRFALQMFVEKYIQPRHPEIGLRSRFRLPDKIDTAVIGKHVLTIAQK